MWPTWHEDRAFAFVLFLLMLLGVGFLGVQIAKTAKEAMEVGKPVPYEHTIYIEGMGKASGVPDVATISFSVEARDADTAVAQSNSAEVMNKLLGQMRGLGIEDADIKTSNYNIWQDSMWNPDTEIYEPGDWVASQTVEIKIRDTSKTSLVIQTAGQNGATNVSGPNYMIDDTSDVKALAREDAINDALEKAQIIADRLNLRLERIIGYSEYAPSEPSPYPYYGGVADSAKNMVMPELPAGSSEVVLTVNVTFKLVE